jgi:hypothetical protein
VRSFDEACTLDRIGDSRFVGEATPDWGQGRALFGGVVAGAAVRAVTSVEAGPVRSVAVEFVAPVAVGAFEVAVASLRSGRAVQHLAAEVSQDGALCARVQVALAAPRPSGVRAAVRAVEPDLARHEPPFVFPSIPGVTPAFLDRFELALTHGSFPYSGADRGGLAGLTSHRTTATGPAALVALLDAWPPATAPMVAGPSPASSVRLTATLFEAGPPAGPAWLHEEVVWAADGLALTRGLLFDADRQRLLAGVEQLVAVFDQR